MKKIKKGKKANKKKAIKELQKKIEEFGRHPEECYGCQAPFERNHETVKSWKVMHYKAQKKVFLFCPDCWTKMNNEEEE